MYAKKIGVPFKLQNANLEILGMNSDWIPIGICNLALSAQTTGIIRKIQLLCCHSQKFVEVGLQRAGHQALCIFLANMKNATNSNPRISCTKALTLPYSSTLNFKYLLLCKSCPQQMWVDKA